ncbi:MAG: radical SAM protein [Theionarchaea archaeon]|nr:radical SAM protein [Theionarchaea archaeon]
MSSYIPEIVGWELTLRCNLQCVHCGSSASPSSIRGQELSLEECLSVVGQLAALKAKRITLTGGEPFLSEHWKPLAQFICEKGIELQFVSNSVLIDEPLVKNLEDLPGKITVGLSLDGATSRTHDYIRNRPGLFSKVIESIDLLNDHGIFVAIITTVHKDNFDELPEIYKILAPSGIYAWQIQMAMPIGRMSSKPEKVLQGEDALLLAQFIARIRDEGDLRVETADNLGYYNSLEPKLRDSAWTGCMAGIRVLGIRSNGDITGCLSLLETTPEGNIRDKPLSIIWENPYNFSYNRNFKITDLKGVCKNCKFGSICRGGCSFLCQSFTGEYHNNPMCLRCYDKDPDSVLLVG